MRRSGLLARARALVLAGMTGAVLAACAPIVSNHGYVPDEQRLASIVPGQDTRETVAQKIGRPAMESLFTEDAWYYSASTVERYLYHAPRVTERTVIAVRFDPEGRVAAVNRYGLEDGRIIDLETRTTPTAGRELTILQQVFGNIGQLSGETLLQNQ